jgi:signal transduction histidine kinase
VAPVVVSSEQKPCDTIGGVFLSEGRDLTVAMQPQRMDHVWKQRVLTWSVPLGLVCALVGLAFLQFRWSVEVSQATTTRIHADLQDSMMNFRQDLSRDIGGLCLDLQVVSGTSTADAKSLASRLQHWQRTSPHPALPQDIYLWQASGKDGSSLCRLLLADGRFEQIKWPEELEGLRQALITTQTAPITNSARSRSTNQTTTARTTNLNSPEIGGIDESVPMLAIPATPHSTSNWLLIKLDLAVLQNGEFPQLAIRYFGDLRTSDYAVGVIAGPMADRKVIYSSDTSVLKDGAISSDSSLNLFGPPVAPRSAPHFPTAVFDTSGSARQGAQGFPMSDPSGTFGPVRLDPIQSLQGEADWRVVARHRKGSVEAAVADLRRRNLALSFGVLLVLAGSISTLLFYSQRARRLAGLQVEFVAGVSHELRTPVAAILSISDNLAAGVVTEREKVIDYGTHIRNQARQLSHLVEQVLRFSSMTRNTNELALGPIDATEVIQVALQNTSTAIDGAGVQVHLEIEPNLPMLLGKFDALSQCLQNLITNAVKYCGNDKWVRIHAELNRAHNPPKEMKVTVEDHGIGIEPQDRDRIFEPFYRSPEVAESELHGTGLGLALARDFAESMGGRITVASIPRQGSTFTVYLPLTNAAPIEQPNA